MFEDVCLQCGKHLSDDDGRAYCSDECQSLDSVSPSISSASSAVSSPCLSGHPLSGDIPALVPSAIGSAFRDYPNHYSISSPASSTAWSAVSDEDGIDHTGIKVDGEYVFHDGDSGFSDGPSKSTNFLPPTIHSSALSYARRPSGTDNRSTVPVLHRRTSSVSTSEHVQGVPSSAPIRSPSTCSSADEEDSPSDFKHPAGYLSLTGRAWAKHSDYDKSTLTNSKPKRNRNRASLPAYFSLLHVNGETRLPGSSSAQTAARPSPPTPKVPLASLTTAAGLRSSPEGPPTALANSTPRGRRQDPGTSRSSRRSEASFSRSRSQSRAPAHTTEDIRARVDSKGSVAQVFNWSNLLVPRGRTTIRRNSSPPPKMVLPGLPSGQSRSSEPFGRVSNGQSDSRRSRGRSRIDELDGIGSCEVAPGYGYGRSGLLDRERLPSHHVVGAYR